MCFHFFPTTHIHLDLFLMQFSRSPRQQTPPQSKLKKECLETSLFIFNLLFPGKEILSLKVCGISDVFLMRMCLMFVAEKLQELLYFPEPGPLSVQNNVSREAFSHS